MCVSATRQLSNLALLALPKCGLQLGGELLDQAVNNVGMVNLGITLCHHFRQVTVARRVSKMPTDAGQDDFFYEAVSFEVGHVGNLGGVCWAA